jgi:hypothetical protein
MCVYICTVSLDRLTVTLGMILMPVMCLHACVHDCVSACACLLSLKSSCVYCMSSRDDMNMF